MNKIYIILSLSIFYFFNCSAQNDICEIHLSYNILPSNHVIKKYSDENNQSNFYIEKQHFKAVNKPVRLDNYVSIKNKLISIDHFINISIKIKRYRLDEGEKKEVVYIIPNSKVFKNIYLYEKKGKDVFRYKVNWIDEIQD